MTIESAIGDINTELNNSDSVTVSMIAGSL